MKYRVAAGVFLALAAACGSPPRRQTPVVTPAATEEPRADTFATKLRPAKTSLEVRLAAAGALFDPALDCVARALAARPDKPDPLRYRHVLSMRCGSPFYVLRAEVGDDDQLVEAARALDREFPSGAALVAGVAAVEGLVGRVAPVEGSVGRVASAGGAASVGSRHVVVLARRVIELEPVSRAGAARLRGRVLVPATAGKLFVSTANGVTMTPIQFTDGAFDVETRAPAGADIELTMTSGRSTEPIGRLQTGNGSPLFRSDGSLMTRINAARRVIGASPLERRDQPGTCSDVLPPQRDGVEITDRARCFRVPMMDFAGLPDELAHRPQLQDILLTKTASFIELGETPPGWVSVRMLHRFETLAPEVGRARVFELLRRRWSALPERKLAAIAEVVEIWSKDPDAYNTSATYKPQLDKLAAKWTTTKRYYTGLVAARDLETALDLITPEQTPLAVDVALLQIRRPDGAMVHLVGVVLELP